MTELEKIKFVCDVFFYGNAKRMLRIVSDGLEKAKKENNLALVEKIENDLILIRELAK